MKAAGFGGGFAFVGCVMLFTWAWWDARPAKPKPWDTKSITATFIDAKSYGGDNAYFEFEYGLKNNTDTDYRLPDRLRVMSSSSTGTLDELAMSWMPSNVFVPAHQTIDYKLQVPYKSLFNGRTPDPDETKELAFLNDQMSSGKGYVMFDEENRYEIVLPSGFKK